MKGKPLLWVRCMVKFLDGELKKWWTQLRNQQSVSEKKFDKEVKEHIYTDCQFPEILFAYFFKKNMQASWKLEVYSMF